MQSLYLFIHCFHNYYIDCLNCSNFHFVNNYIVVGLVTYSEHFNVIELLNLTTLFALDITSIIYIIYYIHLCTKHFI